MPTWGSVYGSRLAKRTPAAALPHRVPDRPHDAGRIDPEEISQCGARVAAPEAVGAKRQINAALGNERSDAFRNGANVWQIPTNNINLAFAAHQAPRGTTSLSCSTSLEVSASRLTAEAEGVNAFLTKPTSSHELLEVAGRMLYDLGLAAR